MSEPVVAPVSNIPNDTQSAWKWNAKRERAAVLVAEDELTDNEISAEVKIARPTLSVWKRHPEFAARVAAVVAELGERSLRYAISRRTRRVQSLDDRWRGMQRVIDERGASPEMAGVPGGETGLLVRTVRSVGTGDQQQVVEEFTVDTALLKEMRETEKQAAQELGQWTEKKEVSGEIVVKRLGPGLSMDDL